MNNELADEIFRLSIEEQRIENRKWEIRKKLEMNTWNEVATVAMKFKMEIQNVNA